MTTLYIYNKNIVFVLQKKMIPNLDVSSIHGIALLMSDYHDFDKDIS